MSYLSPTYDHKFSFPYMWAKSILVLDSSHLANDSQRKDTAPQIVMDCFLLYWFNIHGWKFLYIWFCYNFINNKTNFMTLWVTCTFGFSFFSQWFSSARENKDTPTYLMAHQNLWCIPTRISVKLMLSSHSFYYFAFDVEVQQINSYLNNIMI